MSMLKKLLFIAAITLVIPSCKIVTGVFYTKKWIPKSTPLEKSYLDTIPFTIDYGWIMLEATVAGKKGAYALDSGAPTIINQNQINRNGVKTKPKGADTVISPWSFFPLLKWPYSNLIETLQIGNSSFNDVGAMTVDFAHFANETACEKTQGIIGANVMNDGVWSVRYATNQVIFSDDISKLNITKTHAFKMIPFGIVKSPVIEMEIGGVMYKALIDLGNSGPAAIINNKWTDELNLIPLHINTPATLMGHPTPPRTVEFVEIEFLKTKSNAFHKPLEILAAQKSGIETKKPLKGIDIILGYDFLKNFNVTFDWPNEMVYFEPIEKEFNKKKELKWSNFKIDFFNYDKKVYVMSVLPQYCDTTQVSVGDTVVAINNIPIKEIVGDDYCAFVKREKSLTPKNGDPIFITVKDKAGRVTTLEQKEIILFE
jgi:predicted aspartyl protease